MTELHPDEDLQPAIKAEEGMLDELVSTLKRNPDDRSIVSAALFGSAAMRKERQDIDIDLLIISNDFDAANICRRAKALQDKTK
jgi:predicted nucleotidyltransferase